MSTPQSEREFWERAASGDFEALRQSIWGEAEPGAWETRIPECLGMIVPALRRGLGRRKSVSILDLGCGIGRLTLPVAQIFPKATVIGVDISQAMLDRAALEAAGEGVDNVVWTLGDGRTLPVTGTLHAAYCMITFQHMPWSAAAGYIGQVAERLADGGVFRFQVVEGADEHFLSHHTNERAVRDACDAAGLEVSAYERGGMYAQWSWVTATKRGW